MKTYDYILAMKEANQSMELESIDDSDFSSDDESIDSDLPEKPSFISKFICRGQGNQVFLERVIVLIGNRKMSNLIVF